MEYYSPQQKPTVHLTAKHNGGGGGWVDGGGRDGEGGMWEGGMWEGGMGRDGCGRGNNKDA